MPVLREAYTGKFSYIFPKTYSSDKKIKLNLHISQENISPCTAPLSSLLIVVTTIILATISTMTLSLSILFLGT